MRKFVIVAAALAFVAAPVFADDDPSEAEVARIKEAIAAFGCEGGEFEKETEGTGVLEAEDVKWKLGQYDFRLSKDFKVTMITAD